MSESISSRKACEILKTLYERAENTKGELELSVNDTLLNRREAGLENYRGYLRKYKEYYKDIQDNLVQFADKKILLDFIIEQAISSPMLLVDLAKALKVEYSWECYPVREIIDSHGMRKGY